MQRRDDWRPAASTPVQGKESKRETQRDDMSSVSRNSCHFTEANCMSAGVYRGYGPSVAGIIVYRAGYFGLYDFSKVCIPKRIVAFSEMLVVCSRLGFEQEWVMLRVEYRTQRDRFLFNSSRRACTHSCCRMPYRGALLIRNTPPVGPYSSPMPGGLW